MLDARLKALGVAVLAVGEQPLQLACMPALPRRRKHEAHRRAGVSRSKVRRLAVFPAARAHFVLRAHHGHVSSTQGARMANQFSPGLFFVSRSSNSQTKQPTAQAGEGVGFWRCE